MLTTRNIKDIIADLGSSTNPTAQHELNEKAFNICREYIGGIWNKVNLDVFDISKISGGMTNMVFLCSLADSIQPETTEPTKAILRVYFNPDIDKNLVTEIVVFAILAEKKLGPKLLGTFEGGRLEEYIPSRALKYYELGNQRFSPEIAKAIARIHKLDMPMKKKPTFLLGLLTQWMSQLSEHKKPQDVIPIPEKYSQWAPKSIMFEELGQHVDSMKELIAKSPSKVVFCHNDIVENNLLLVESDSNDSETVNPELVLIDYEFASYNYRGFEFGNHFVEWSIDYDVKEPPFYEINTDLLPSEERMFEFILDYLKEYHSSDANDDLMEEAKSIVQESLPFIPVDHMLWGVFSLMQVYAVNAIDFDFGKIAGDRLGMYYQYRHLLKKLQ
uniref:Choline/ethanolamine kinase n=1 Tax=Panagrellus redivivus TaxID=6233 RepID=A0A7E4W5J7_PANRE